MIRRFKRRVLLGGALASLLATACASASSPEARYVAPSGSVFVGGVEVTWRTRADSTLMVLATNQSESFVRLVNTWVPRVCDGKVYRMTLKQVAELATEGDVSREMFQLGPGEWDVALYPLDLRFREAPLSEDAKCYTHVHLRATGSGAEATLVVPAPTPRERGE